MLLSKINQKSRRPITSFWPPFSLIFSRTFLQARFCFILYYGNKTESTVVLGTGVVAIVIVYHFWVRIIMGNVSKLFRKNINYKQWWFKEHRFEKGLYKLLRVKKWKDKTFTYNPGDFDLKNKSLEEIANIMSKSEVDHWINELISVCSLLFALIWPNFFIALVISAICAMIFDSQFIIIQRYNRPRIVKALEHQKKSDKREEKEEDKVESKEEDNNNESN